jgi:MYXO-CTERM domain-containing protein
MRSYARTGVLSNQNSANGDLSNLIVTLSNPALALSLNHSTWRGTQLDFILYFASGPVQYYTATSAGVNPSTPMAFTGFVSDVPITGFLISTVQSVNDQFARGFNIDNLSTASPVPEPATMGLAGLALGALGLWRRRS